MVLLCGIEATVTPATTVIFVSFSLISADDTLEQRLNKCLIKFFKKSVNCCAELLETHQEKCLDLKKEVIFVSINATIIEHNESIIRR